MNGRNLTTKLTGALSCVYQRTDNALNQQNIIDNFSYTGFRSEFANGVEDNQADLFYHANRDFLVAGGPEAIDLDAGDLTNVFGDELRFEKIRCIIIKNKEALGSGSYLAVSIQDDTYTIGPQGHRIIWEPTGLFDSGGSSGVAGILTLDSSADVNYDLIIIGVSALINPISSGS